MNLGIAAKKYYQRVSKLEINDAAADVKNDDVADDDVDELNSRILKATPSPKNQVDLKWPLFILLPFLFLFYKTG